MSASFVNASNLSSQNHNSSADGFEAEIQQSQIGSVITYYVMIVLSLVGNTVVIKAIKRIGRNLRRQVHYLFIVNLSVADLLFALEMAPMIYVHILSGGTWHIRGRFGEFLCQFDVFLSAVLILTSNLTILAIAVEMSLGIFFPLKTLVSKKRAYFIVATTWFVSGCYSAPLFSFAHLKANAIGDVVCSVGITSEKVVQWFIFQTMLLAAGFVITLALYSAIGVKLCLLKAPGFQFHQVQRQGRAKKAKAVKMLALLVFVFYISFIPFWILQLSLHFGFYDRLTSHYSTISAFLMLCNGTVNPVIYCAYNKDIRDEFKCLITCKLPPERTRSLMAFSARTMKRKKYEDLKHRSPNKQFPTKHRSPDQQFPTNGLAVKIMTHSKTVQSVTGEITLACRFEETPL